jgi:hypothetical protein
VISDLISESQEFIRRVEQVRQRHRGCQQPLMLHAAK